MCVHVLVRAYMSECDIVYFFLIYYLVRSMGKRLHNHIVVQSAVRKQKRVPFANLKREKMYYLANTR